MSKGDIFWMYDRELLPEIQNTLRGNGFDIRVAVCTEHRPQSFLEANTEDKPLFEITKKTFVSWGSVDIKRIRTRFREKIEIIDE